MQSCPTCGRVPTYASLPDAKRLRPFCSERCKTADLAAWASEAYRLPTDERIEDRSEDKEE